MRAKLIHVGSTIASFAFLATPAIVAAQQPSTAQGLLGTLGLVSRIVNGLLGLLVMVAILAFFWGLIKYLFSMGEEKSEGLKIMFYGVIAIFVMVSIWGLVGLLRTTFGVQSNNPIIPQGVQSF